MWETQCKTPKNVKNQGNITSTKDHNNPPIIKPKETDICDLHTQKRIQNSCFMEMWGATRKHKKTVQQNQENSAQSENFNKEEEIIKKEPNWNSGAKEFNE